MITSMWPCIVSIVVGLWVMISPAIFTSQKSMADVDYICGPLLITFAVIALWEINRSVIKANLVVAIGLIVATLLIQANTNLFISNLASSLVIIGLSLVKGTITESFGGGWKSLFEESPLHIQEAEKLQSN